MRTSNIERNTNETKISLYLNLDSKEPKASYEDFIMGEVRYNSLARSNPERAKELFEKAQADAKAKYEKLVEMAK